MIIHLKGGRYFSRPKKMRKVPGSTIFVFELSLKNDIFENMLINGLRKTFLVLNTEISDCYCMYILSVYIAQVCLYVPQFRHPCQLTAYVIEIFTTILCNLGTKLHAVKLNFIVSKVTLGFISKAAERLFRFK